MNSAEITDALALTAKLMELHNENPFKARAYANAAFRLNKLRYNYEGKTKAEIAGVEGVGNSMADKIMELLQTGSTADLSELLKKTPVGIIEIMGIKGLGPKKVKQLWEELKIESVGELLYACSENRLVTLKGFGEKTQSQIIKAIEFRQSANNKYHYASLQPVLNGIISDIQNSEPDIRISLTGEMARKCEIIENVSVLSTAHGEQLKKYFTAVPVDIDYITCSEGEFYYKLVESSSTTSHLEKTGFYDLQTRSFDSEAAVYDALGLQNIPAELREGLEEVGLARKKQIPELIKYDDLKGVLHNHTTYSDGIDTLKEMADYCQSKGFGYLGICDHSRAAFYANGLSIDTVERQQKEIDALNKQYTDFRILKGIESDILSDGSLDYPEEILKTFDFVVASVHSNLKMNETRATERLLRAIENPYATILGHPSGRLLLARSGYPLDYKRIIDACAANKVAIELNAHPYRLDIDWRWIPYCLEKGVKISINPDAHHKAGIEDMFWGVCAARKGMLTAKDCLNALPLPDLLAIFKK
jgi:DNA polymerase (family X)